MTPSLTPGAFLRHGFELYRRNADPLWRIVFPLTLACEVVILLVVLRSIPSGAEVIGGTIYVPAGSSLGAFNAARIFAEVLFGVTGVLASGAMTRLLVASAAGRPESPGDALRHALARFPSLLWVSILVSAAIAGGTLLLFVPGFYMVGALAAAVPALMAEDRRGFAALRRSRELVRGEWWPAFCATFVVGVVLAAVGFGVERGLELNGSVTGFELAHAAGLLIVEIFVTPFAVATVAAVYLDLRAAKEPETLPVAYAPGPAAPPAAPADNPWL